MQGAARLAGGRPSRLARWFWEERGRFQAELVPLDEAIRRARMLGKRVWGEPLIQHLTLDEVEVYAVDGNVNVALNQPANQSSSSKWSVLDYNPWSSQPVPQQPPVYPVNTVVERGLKLADDLSHRGVDVDAQVRQALRQLGHVLLYAAVDRRVALLADHGHAQATARQEASPPAPGPGSVAGFGSVTAARSNPTRRHHRPSRDRRRRPRHRRLRRTTFRHPSPSQVA